MGHVLLVAIVVDEFALGILTQQIIARTLMGDTCLHRDDGIHQYLEIGRCIALRMGGNGRSEMTAC